MEKLLKKLSIACNLVGNLCCYLITDSLRTVYFAHFQSLLQFEAIFCGSPTNLHKALIKQKRKIRVMLGLRQRASCGQKFKKLPIVTLLRLYVLDTVMFAIKNPHKCQTDVSIQSEGTRQITDFM
jgi:hypothetical protein